MWHRLCAGGAGLFTVEDPEWGYLGNAERLSAEGGQAFIVSERSAYLGDSVWLAMFFPDPPRFEAGLPEFIAAAVRNRAGFIGRSGDLAAGVIAEFKLRSDAQTARSRLGEDWIVAGKRENEVDVCWPAGRRATFSGPMFAASCPWGRCWFSPQILLTTDDAPDDYSGRAT